MPKGVVPYEQRGWPNFERAVSGFIKDGNKVLDLGNLAGACTDWLGLVTSCKAGRSPPMAPETFAKILKTKTFTNGADCAVVESIYSRTFEEVPLGSALLTALCLP